MAGTPVAVQGPGLRSRRSGEHLLRVGALFLAGIAVFIGAQRLLVPKDFGALGHYRPGALADNRDRPSLYAGHATCEECHTEVAETKRKGKHAGPACEACHGPLATHASDPSIKPARPDARTLCVRCHAALVGRPSRFPQIQPADHVPEGASCLDCHVAHDPALGGTR